MTRHVNPPGPPHAGPPGRLPEEDRSQAATEPEPSPPETLVVGGHLFVTLDVPEIPRGFLSHYVGTNLLVVWNSADPERAARVVRFPVDVHPERAVVRVVNGVLDLEVPVARPEGTRAGPAKPPDTSRDSSFSPSDLPLEGSP